MAEIKLKIKVRKDTTANLQAMTTVLENGEVAYSTNDHVLKVGDGTKAWNSLPNIFSSNADTLDNHDSDYFLNTSATGQIKSGNLTVNGGATASGGLTIGTLGTDSDNSLSFGAATGTTYGSWRLHANGTSMWLNTPNGDNKITYGPDGHIIAQNVGIGYGNELWTKDSSHIMWINYRSGAETVVTDSTLNIGNGDQSTILAQFNNTAVIFNRDVNINATYSLDTRFIHFNTGAVNTRLMRWNSSDTDVNSHSLPWYGSGLYNGEDNTSHPYLNISNYWGIDLTARGDDYIMLNSNPIATRKWVNETALAHQSNTAKALARSGDLTHPMTFYWDGSHGNQPTWLWGGEDGTNMYVYNPSNFSVSSATKATQDASGHVITDYYRTIDDSYSKSQTPLRRYGSIIDGNLTAGTTWGKVADITMPVTNTDKNISFLVEGGHVERSRIIGILRLSVRNNNSATSVIVEHFSWLVKTDNASYPLSSFVAIQNGLNVSIYVKTVSRFNGITLSELDEYGTYGDSTFGSYALYSVINPTITDLSTVTGTKTVSTMDVIENTAASATNAKNATNDDAGNRISTTYLSKAAGLTKSAVGLGNVDNTSDKDKPISTATQTALDKKQDTLVSGTNIKTIEGNSILGSGNIDLDKSAVGLSNVDNTSDKDKPISTATQTALDKKQDTLVSGTNIKTINSTSILGSGDITIASTSYTAGDNITITTDNKINANCVPLGTVYGTGAGNLAGGTGSVAGTSGKNSINMTAYGASAKASGSYSTASGYGSTASGSNSTAIGSNSTASGYGSIASGNGSTASGSYSTASGSNSTASGNGSTASGSYSTASGSNSTASGYGSTASGNGSTAIGSLYLSSNNYPSYNNINNSVTFDGQYNSSYPTVHPNANIHVGYLSNIIIRNSDQTSTAASVSDITTAYPNAKSLQYYFDQKQDTLVSGTNIKTINGSSVLGTGDLAISGTVPQWEQTDYAIEVYYSSGDSMYNFGATSNDKVGTAYFSRCKIGSVLICSINSSVSMSSNGWYAIKLTDLWGSASGNQSVGYGDSWRNVRCAGRTVSPYKSNLNGYDCGLTIAVGSSNGPVQQNYGSSTGNSAAPYLLIGCDENSCDGFSAIVIGYIQE